MSNVIEIEGLTKKYKGAIDNSLDNVSFTVSSQEKLGIFGPNGAGKTTLISILCGIIDSSEGNIHFIKDSSPVDLRSMLYKVGYVPQEFSLYPELTPKQNLRYFGALYSIPKEQLEKRIDHLLKVLGLSHVANNKVDTFSGGMKRRVNLAIGIINEPDILFLDEPTVGVDVQSKNAIMTYLDALNENGTTIIYTSHHLNEGQEFCNRIMLLDKGNLIANDTLDNLLKAHEETSLETLFLKLTGIEYRD